MDKNWSLTPPLNKKEHHKSKHEPHLHKNQHNVAKSKKRQTIFTTTVHTERKKKSKHRKGDSHHKTHHESSNTSKNIMPISSHSKHLKVVNKSAERIEKHANKSKNGNEDIHSLINDMHHVIENGLIDFKLIPPKSIKHKHGADKKEDMSLKGIQIFEPNSKNKVIHDILNVVFPTSRAPPGIESLVYNNTTGKAKHKHSKRHKSKKSNHNKNKSQPLESNIRKRKHKRHEKLNKLSTFVTLYPLVVSGKNKSDKRNRKGSN